MSGEQAWCNYAPALCDQWSKADQPFWEDIVRDPNRLAALGTATPTPPGPTPTSTPIIPIETNSAMICHSRFRSWQELISSAEKAVVGNINSGDGATDPGTQFLQEQNWPIKNIFGYKDSEAIRGAFDRGELHLTTACGSLYPDYWFEMRDRLWPLFYWGEPPTSSWLTQIGLPGVFVPHIYTINSSFWTDEMKRAFWNSFN
jgi:hypothetical protein